MHRDTRGVHEKATEQSQNSLQNSVCSHARYHCQRMHKRSRKRAKNTTATTAQQQDCDKIVLMYHIGAYAPIHPMYHFFRVHSVVVRCVQCARLCIQYNVSARIFVYLFFAPRLHFFLHNIPQQRAHKIVIPQRWRDMSLFCRSTFKSLFLYASPFSCSFSPDSMLKSMFNQLLDDTRNVPIIKKRSNINQ